MVENKNSKKLTDILSNLELPFVLKDKTVMAPGIWNKYLYTQDEIEKSYKCTDWENPQVLAYYLNHEDNEADKWIGSVSNPKYIPQSGEIIADVLIFDLNEAIKASLGNQDFGISPKVAGKAVNGQMKDFVFKNFSHVVDPAVRLATISNSEIEEGITMVVEQMRDWDTSYVNDLPDSAFAVIEKDYLEGKIQDKNARHLPYKNKEGNVDLPHLRNALARVNQIEPIGQSETKDDLIKKAMDVLEPVAKEYLKTHQEENKMDGDKLESNTEVKNAEPSPAEPQSTPAEPSKPSVSLDEVMKKLDEISKTQEAIASFCSKMDSMFSEMEMACKPKEKTMASAEPSVASTEPTEVKNSAQEVKPEVSEVKTESKSLVEQELKSKKIELENNVSYTNKGTNSADKGMLKFLQGRL